MIVNRGHDNIAIGAVIIDKTFRNVLFTSTERIKKIISCKVCGKLLCFFFVVVTQLIYYIEFDHTHF